jgi:PAS domain S-box-containing protein
MTAAAGDAARSRWARAAAQEANLGWATVATGIALTALTPSRGWSAPLWFGPGLYLGPYLVALGVVLAWRAAPPRASLWAQLALGFLLLAAIAGALVSLGQAPDARQAHGVLLPWPAGAIGCLALSALLVRALPLPAMRGTQVAVALLLVPPLLLAFSYLVVVQGYARSRPDLGVRLSLAACVAAAGLMSGAASIVLGLWRRHTGQPGRDSRDDGTVLALTLIVSMGIPLAVACGSVLGGVAAAREATRSELGRHVQHLQAHARALQVELDRAGVRDVALAPPGKAAGSGGSGGHLFWQDGDWWIQHVDGPPERSTTASVLFDVAHAADTTVWLCQPVAQGRRCWVRSDLEPRSVQLSPDAVVATGAGLIVTTELPPAGLTVVMSRETQPQLDGALDAMGALAMPALALAALGVLLTIGVVLPMVQRLDRLRHRLSLLLEHVPAAVVTIDAQGNVGTANAAANALLDLDANGQARPDGLLARIVAAARPGAAGGSVAPIALSLRDSQDRRVDVEVSAHPVPADSAGTHVMLVRDVTRRNRAEARVQWAAKWSDAVLRTAGEGICVVTHAGELLQANPAALDLLGLPHAPAPADTRPCTVPAAIEPFWLAMVRDAMRHADTQRGRLMLPTPAGEERCVEFVIAHMDAAHEALVVVLREVTAERRISEALAFANDLLRSTEEIGRIGSWHLDLRTGRQTWSAGKFRIHGLPPDTRLSPELHEQFVHPDDRDRLAGLIGDTLARKVPHEVRYRIIVDGEVRWVEGRGSFTFDADGTAVAWSGSIQDISEMQRRERALLASRRRVRELAARREQEREEERARLAREVHDELGQQLSAVRLAVHRLEVLAGTVGADIGGAVADLKEQIDRTSAGMRSIIQNLRPAVLDFGLPAAVEWLVEDFRTRHGVALFLENGLGESPLPGEVANTIFRCLQEALTNVARHAGASRVTVRLFADADDLVLEVEDDGAGFDPAEVRGRRAFGLMGMRERALALGGRLRVDSLPEAGTHLVLRVPKCPAQPHSNEVEGEVE